MILLCLASFDPMGCVCLSAPQLGLVPCPFRSLPMKRLLDLLPGLFPPF
jgi:hypothetical protein